MISAAARPSVVLLPFSCDPLQRLALQLLDEHSARLPDLTSATILIPDTQLGAPLRRLLLIEAAQRGFPALLGPQILTLREWLAQFSLKEQVVGQYGQELMLIEALREHHELYGTGSLWTLTDALLELFAELTLNQVGLPEDLNQFQRRIAQAYSRSLQNECSNNIAMEMETRLVHTLWHAWHAQLRDSRQIDSATATLLRMRASLENTSHGRLYLLDPCGYSRAESVWLRALIDRQQAVLFIQGEFATNSGTGDGYLPDGWLSELLRDLPPAEKAYNKDSQLNLLLHQVYDPGETPMRDRASAFRRVCVESPLPEHLEIFSADSAEQEARAVETQVRLWLLAGRNNIGIVTENRRLARRVRALLERAHIHVNDAAGWALSTTSAAAVVERWLECVEEDFPWRPLFDLLKSPFFCTADERDAHLATVYRFEQEIIHTDNIGSGLARYRARIAERQKLLASQGSGDYAPMISLLERLEQAASWLTPCFTETTLEVARIIDLLQASLREVGLAPLLNADAAGMRLLDELQQMYSAAGGGSYPMQWQEFRTWLGRSLERYNFLPPMAGQSVQLMSLAQSTMQHFDAVILAGAEQEHLPGGEKPSPFFNDHVRRELGLTTREHQLARRFHLFRRLLESAKSMLITHRREKDGEEVLLSPWIELLTAFHHLAWGEMPNAATLRRLVDSPASEVTHRSSWLPANETRPAPVLPPSRIPHTLSASGYQQLIDCPYLFFATQGLHLAPPDTIREALEKADYGEKVHRCLQAFHEGVEGLPGPFGKRLSVINRDDALGLMQEIATTEFQAEDGLRFENHAWLKRWQELIPAYIDWQIERESEWQVLHHEELCERDDVIDAIKLRGRLDRIDQGPTGIAVIDYKTGQIAKRADIMQGEAVQLPFYALLAESGSRHVAQVEFVRMDEGRVSTPIVVLGEDLEQLREANRARIGTLIEQMRDGTPLPAWGDETACNRCTMEGLCRRQTWPL